jgi:hypothetical protein
MAAAIRFAVIAPAAATAATAATLRPLSLGRSLVVKSYGKRATCDERRDKRSPQ